VTDKPRVGWVCL